MEAFAERSIDTYFEFSLLQFFIVLFISVLVGVIFFAIFHWPVGLGVGAGVFFLLYAILGKCRPFGSSVCYRTLLYGAVLYSLYCWIFSPGYLRFISYAKATCTSSFS